MRCDLLLALGSVNARLLVGGALVVATAACDPGPLPDDPLYVPVAIPGCTPNGDGAITADELPFVVGATARVRVGKNLAIAVDGEPGDSGEDDARVWDLSRPSPDDEPVGLLTLEGMEGQWFAATFPDADVAGPLEPGNALLGPLVIDDDGVKLLGTASRLPDAPEGQTLLAYDAPVPLYPFPLEMGASSSTSAQIRNGLAYGVPVAVADTYHVEVTAHGRVILPDLILEDALRVTLRRESVPVAGIATQQVTHIFMNACIGEVARLVSPLIPLTDDLPNDFPVAAEVRRLAL